jgi:hypothetical protein
MTWTRARKRTPRPGPTADPYAATSTVRLANALGNADVNASSLRLSRTGGLTCTDSTTDRRHSADCTGFRGLPFNDPFHELARNQGDDLLYSLQGRTFGAPSRPA